jgi:hypothetical protein
MVLLTPQLNQNEKDKDNIDFTVPFNFNKNVNFPSQSVSSRPQVSNNIMDHNIESKHLDTSELDIINKVYHTETKPKEEKIFLNMSIQELIQNTIDFMIHFNEKYSKKLKEISKKNKSQLKYIFALISHLNDDYNLIYFGILLIFISIILYFFNITSS